MEVRFKLDPQLDRDIIASILDRASGGNTSKAVYLILVERQALINCHVSPRSRREPDAKPSDSRPNADEMEDRAAGLAEEW